MKKFFTAFLCSASVLALTFNVYAESYSDVPQDFWAAESIQKAGEYGFISGMGDGIFGVGENVTKAQFISMVCRLFNWDIIDYQYSSINDNQNPENWYYEYVETAALNGAIDKGGFFNPENNITREEMAVIIINALGYSGLVGEAERENLLFSDVSDNKGYIALAYNFGFMSGKTADKFDPKGTAKREEAAAILTRCYEKLNSPTEFLHGFYAFSSYGQREMASKMDSVSFGWSRMEYTNEKGVVLNTLSSNGNEWVVPSGYENIVNYLNENDVKTHLNVFMSNGFNNSCDKVLNSEENRKAAIDAIIEELSYDYKNLGFNPYGGVTIDFENLKGSETKNNFNVFLKELKTELDKTGKTLYVAVQPKLKTGSYFDGYDFKTIGDVADKVIVMAYDYAPSSISQEVMDSGFTTTPVTPFDEVYVGLREIVSPETGVSDKNKIVLGTSISNIGWTVKDGKIVNGTGSVLTQQDIINTIKNGNEVKYSKKYKNPYMNIADTNGNTIVWFENAQSIKDKITLAKMFGIKGVSVWRLGLIPENEETGMNIWSVLEK